MVLKGLILTVSTLQGFGAHKSTEFNSFYSGGCVCLARTDFNSFYF